MPAQKTDLRIEVPDSCFVTKNWFNERPTSEQTRAWRQEIARTGKPHLVAAHTHTRPPPGSAPIYLDTFDLPTKQVRLGYMAPCPCCTPRHMKYGYDGKIAWFKDEGVIRMIGPDCFASLDPEAHQQASAELSARKKRERDVAYLLKNRVRHLHARDALAEALPMAEAANDLSRRIKKVLTETLDIQLWEHIKRGQLLCSRKVIQFDPKTGSSKEIVEDALYAQISGFRLLKPDLKNYAHRVLGCVTALDQVAETADWKSHVEQMTETQRDKVAQIISTAIKTGKGLIQELRDLQSFVSMINTVRNWAQTEGCHCPLAIYRKGDDIFLAKSWGLAHIRVSIPEAFEVELLNIDAPTLSDPLISDL